YETLVKNNVPPAQAQQIVAQPGAIGYTTYWGDKAFTSGPYYFGVITLFLFILGLGLLKGPMKWGLLLGTLLVVLLSFGRDLQWFSALFFYYFPLHHVLRAVKSVLIVAAFTIPLLEEVTRKRIFARPHANRKALQKHFEDTFYAL